jgi:hypothetical protein
LNFETAFLLHQAAAPDRRACWDFTDAEFDALFTPVTRVRRRGIHQWCNSSESAMGQCMDQAGMRGKLTVRGWDDRTGSARMRLQRITPEYGCNEAQSSPPNQ